MVHMFCGLRSHAENRYPSKKIAPKNHTLAVRVVGDNLIE